MVGLLHQLSLNLLLLKNDVHVCALLLFSFLKFNGVAGSEIHKWNVDSLNGLTPRAYQGSIRHWCSVRCDVVIVRLIGEIGSCSGCMIEPSCIVSSYHVGERVILMRKIHNPLSWVGVILQVSRCQNCWELI
jgi:hypothetical protein